ncbi:hypothetical protein PtA15_6A604 [Puccinia triticina]|uniref:AGC-kinase C-terminal domain-containing protein n=1 Tax=Puccinia triticina TaxID=208348 RepID=A0ABY7CMS8_9BASI|nr:uncharacterized protein PtA15_6A604 [Puccinia triticina]WAQ85974.1 hypothetical protein PtA15_6A604 [Puccinia triticina]
MSGQHTKDQRVKQESIPAKLIHGQPNPHESANEKKQYVSPIDLGDDRHKHQLGHYLTALDQRSLSGGSGGEQIPKIIRDAKDWHSFVSFESQPSTHQSHPPSMKAPPSLDEPAAAAVVVGPANLAASPAVVPEPISTLPQTTTEGRPVQHKRHKLTFEDFEIMRVLGKGCAGKVLIVCYLRPAGNSHPNQP